MSEQLPSKEEICPHGFNLRYQNCSRCENPAFDAAQSPPIGIETAVARFPAVDGRFEIYFRPSNGERGILDDETDVKLRVDGNFDSVAEAENYCGMIASMLNRAAPPPAESQVNDDYESQVKFLQDAIRQMRLWIVLHREQGLPIAATFAQIEADIVRCLPSTKEPALASGCHRSHPHEDMNAECERLTEVARENNRRAHEREAIQCIWRSGCKHPEACAAKQCCVPGGEAPHETPGGHQ